MSERTNCWKCGELIPENGQCNCPLPGESAERRVGDVLNAQARYVSLPIGYNGSGIILPSTMNSENLLGWCITSSASAAGHFRIRDGTSPNSPIIGVGQFATGADSHAWFGDQGINLLGNGLWLDALGGSLEGVIYYV